MCGGIASRKLNCHTLFWQTFVVCAASSNKTEQFTVAFRHNYNLMRTPLFAIVIALVTTFRFVHNDAELFLLRATCFITGTVPIDRISLDPKISCRIDLSWDSVYTRFLVSFHWKLLEYFLYVIVILIDSNMGKKIVNSCMAWKARKKFYLQKGYRNCLVLWLFCITAIMANRRKSKSQNEGTP